LAVGTALALSTEMGIVGTLAVAFSNGMDWSLKMPIVWPSATTAAYGV